MIEKEKQQGPKGEGVRHPQGPSVENKTKTNEKPASTSGKESFIRYFQVIIFSFIILLILLTAVLLYYFYTSDIEVLDDQISKQEELLVTRQQQINEFKNKESDYSKLEDSTMQVLDTLPTDKRLADVYIELETIAIKNNIDINSINIISVTPAGKDNKKKSKDKIDNVEKLEVNLELESVDYYTLKDFINDIERSIRLMDIKSILYTPETEGFSISLYAYYLE